MHLAAMIRAVSRAQGSVAVDTGWLQWGPCATCAILISRDVQAFEKMKDLGLLAGKGGLYGNVFRVKPPMCFTREDADFTLQCFDQALSEL